MGPNGKNSLLINKTDKDYEKNKKNEVINKELDIKITKDGYKILNNIKTFNKYEEIALKILKDCCNKTNKEVGDGTTSTVILLQKLIEIIVKNQLFKLENDNNSINIPLLFELLNKIEDLINENLKYIKINDNISNIALKVAYISGGNNEKINKILNEIHAIKNYEKIPINIAIHDKNNIEIESNNGFLFKSGYFSQLFLDVDKESIIINNPKIYLANYCINDIDKFTTFIEFIALKQYETVIFCQSITEKIIKSLIVNKYQKIIKNICVVIVEQDHIYKKLSKKLKCEIDNKYIDLKYSLGNAKRIIIKEHETIIFDDSFDDNNNININVGGNTELEKEELYEKIVDSLCSMKKSKQYGGIIGGGFGYIILFLIIKDYVSKFIKKYRREIIILIEFLTAINEQLSKNMNISTSNFIIKWKTYKNYKNIYYFDMNNPNWDKNNYKSTWINYYENNIFDSYFSIKSILKNVLSTVKMIISTKYIV